MTSIRRFRRFRPLSQRACSQTSLVALVALSTCLACSSDEPGDDTGASSGGTSSDSGGATSSGGGTGDPAGGSTNGVGGSGTPADGGNGAGATTGAGGGIDGGGGGASAGGAPDGSGGQPTAGAGGDLGSGGGSVGEDACETTSGLEAEFPECFTLQLANGMDAARSDIVVVVNLADIQASHADFNPSAFVVLDGATEVASQSVDQAPKGSPDEIAFSADLGASETRAYAVRYATEGEIARSYPQRAQAIISPKTGGSWSGDTYSGGSYTDVDFLDMEGHIDHDFDYMRFEGPGWESDRIGYRTYADARNAMDIFGKKTPGMILHDIDYVNEDYSTMSDWGMDILKVGEALGIGAVGTMEGGAASRIASLQNITIDILESGPLVALLRITYVDWQTAAGTVTLTTDISIHAGSRLSKVVAQVDGSLPNLCTGIAKHDGTNMVSAPTTTGWNFLANYGLQSLVPDDVGLGVLYHTDDLIEVTEDSINHLVVLSPDNGPLTYYFLGAWVQEGGGVTSESEYASYLESTIQELDSPVGVTIL